MSLAKSFTEEQISTVQSWADAGDGLSEIQKKLDSEMGKKVTYMELRFLIDDLGVTLKEDQPKETDSVDESVEPELEADLGGDAPMGDEATVTISAVQRPGALISGNVSFAGGNSAEWWLDQMGQLGMNPKPEGFTPSPEQMMSFQQELQQAVQKKGF